MRPVIVSSRERKGVNSSTSLTPGNQRQQPMRESFPGYSALSAAKYHYRNIQKHLIFTRLIEKELADVCERS